MPKTKSNASTMKFTKDEFGKEVLLKDDTQKIRMEWEKPYMEACIDALKPHGDVLEIGFGLGYAASQIQKHHPKSHTIIELNPEVAAKARQWAEKQKSNINIIEGKWQDHLDKLRTFDTIFFDDYAFVEYPSGQQLQQTSKQFQQVADKAGKMRNEVAEKLKQFKGLKFSDADLREFVDEAVQKVAITIQDILEFIDNLELMKNITGKQKQQFLLEFHEKAAQNQILREIAIPADLKSSISRVCPSEHFSTFIDSCLKKHMRTGARLSAFVGSPESQQTLTFIENHIRSRKDVHIKEKSVPVTVPSNCQYFDGKNALVITIEKK